MSSGKTGTADIRLSGGTIPPWLFDRMKKLALPIVESILQEYGHKHFLEQLSNPYWFQSFGAVIGRDWNSSGVTTAIMTALKSAVNPVSAELGLYIAGGKGNNSIKTPSELVQIGEKTGLDGNTLSSQSKLIAKIDSSAVQDGFSIYQHYFLVEKDGSWSVIQQGMNPKVSMARRYHWYSGTISSFVEDPHTAICGENSGQILNLVAAAAKPTQSGILEIAKEDPTKMMTEIIKMKLPLYTDVKQKDVNLKRLGAVLWLARDSDIHQFEDLISLKGVGPRTLQSLTLVSEVIHGTPSRFEDPARFSFAHGGKNSRPFAVPTKIYDESITQLQKAVDLAKIGDTDKSTAIKSLSKIATRAEENFTPTQSLDQVVEEEKLHYQEYGSRSVKPPSKRKNNQLGLFE